MDMVEPTRRSEIMRQIKSKDTQPELAVRRYLHARGFRFRLHGNLPGKPDLVLRKYRSAVYVNGCFWHGHGCKDGRRPKSNIAYWNRKLDRNLERDASLAAKLRALGWKRIVVWGCEASDLIALNRVAAEINA